MKNTFKVSSLKLPFVPLIFVFFVTVTFFIYYFAINFGLNGLLGIIVLFLIWLGLLYSIAIFFQTRNDILLVDDIGLKIEYKGVLLNLNWDEINKIGFQSISAKRMGVEEAIPYLAIGLKDISKLQTLKSSKEFGFIQKKNDLASYNDQNNILDLYISMRFASESDSNLQNFLSGKSGYVQKMTPINKVN